MKKTLLMSVIGVTMLAIGAIAVPQKAAASDPICFHEDCNDDGQGGAEFCDVMWFFNCTDVAGCYDWFCKNPF